ncbi:MAG TPA: OmpA family protein [Thermoanaerobaculia bacterium]|nr:OmpA family protein [Thermoanaerobaculia bacterium]
MIRRILVVALFAVPALGQETGKTIDFAPAVVRDLQFKITDLSGNPVSEVAGTVQDLQVREIGNEVRIDLNADVLFDFDKADILPKAEETLTKAAAIIKERAKGTVQINGHTDSKGDDAYNMKLSERRANAVRDWFRTKGGLASFHFNTKGLGETQPVAPNTRPDGSDDPEGRQKNRRVEIILSRS